MRDLLGPLKSAVSRVSSSLMLDGADGTLSPLPDLRDCVEQAKMEWLHAREHFNHVTDPELIDHAIYQVKAAERRYMYLLGLARGETEELSGGGITPPLAQ